MFEIVVVFCFFLLKMSVTFFNGCLKVSVLNRWRKGTRFKRSGFTLTQFEVRVSAPVVFI